MLFYKITIPFTLRNVTGEVVVILNAVRPKSELRAEVSFTSLSDELNILGGGNFNGSSYCHNDDEFNLYTGVKLAVERATKLLSKEFRKVILSAVENSLADGKEQERAVRLYKLVGQEF